MSYKCPVYLPIPVRHDSENSNDFLVSLKDISKQGKIMLDMKQNNYHDKFIISYKILDCPALIGTKI